MLQETQRTSAPRAFRVSISTAVWIVMWSEPAMRAPFRGCFGPYSSRTAIRPGISVSAMRDFLAAEIGEADVFDDVVLRHDWPALLIRFG